MLGIGHQKTGSERNDYPFSEILLQRFETEENYLVEYRQTEVLEMQGDASLPFYTSVFALCKLSKKFLILGRHCPESIAQFHCPLYRFRLSNK